MSVCIKGEILTAILLVGSLAFAGKGTKSAGSIKIETTYFRPSAELNYCRTCCHVPKGTFTVEVVSNPQPKDEWKLESEQPEYLWTISPNVAGTVSGEESRTFSVNLFDADFPRSFSVHVKVTWKLKKESGDNDTSTVEANFEFDAIEYSFSAKSLFESDSMGNDALVDSHNGEVVIVARSCRRTEILNMELTATPNASSWQNEVQSTSMPIQGANNSLSRFISCPYWYAKSGTPPFCCYSNPAEYFLTLKADGCEGHRRLVKVFLPTNDLHGESKVSDIRVPSITCIKKEVVQMSDKKLVKGTFYISNFFIRYNTYSGASSQYKDKIRQEEDFHKKQCEGVEGYEFEDAFSLVDVERAIGAGSNNVWTGTFDNDANLEIYLGTCAEYVRAEYENSLDYLAVNHDYREWKAKQSVGFNEAYKYHCSYERFDGYKASPVEKIAKVRIITDMGGE